MVMNNLEIKNWLKDNKVCFVTNSITEHIGSLVYASLKTYIDYIPDNSFIIIPGLRNGRPNYGLRAFQEMLNNQDIHNFDYIIYIDEDCFIKDFELLLKEFIKFKDSNYCMAGLQDGGMICHRNQSRFLVNTFVSFWNLTLIHNKMDKVNNAIKVFSQNFEQYKAFIDGLKSYKDGKLYNIMNEYSFNMINRGKSYRENNFDHEPPHASIVRHDETNPYEPDQIPYSYKDDEKRNMEPYYAVEEALVYVTGKPIYYLYGSDLYSQSGEVDNSGITTVILGEHNEHILYHTWYARYYQPFMHHDEVITYHTNRINKIIETLS